MKTFKKNLRLQLIIMMLLVAAGLFFLAQPALAQTADLTPAYLLDALNIDYDYQHGKVTASGEVVFTNQEVTIRADRVFIDLNQQVIKAEGQVQLSSADEILNGTSLEYNYKLGQGKIYDGSSEIGGLHFQGGIIEIIRGDEYDLGIEQASFTPCQLPDPHYQIKANRLEIYKDDRVVARKVQFWWGKLKLLSLPGYVVKYEETDQGKRLTDPNPIPRLGYDSEQGAVLELNYPYQLSDSSSGEIKANLTQRGSREIKVDNQYRLNDHFALYNAYLNNKEIDEQGIEEEELIISGIRFREEKISAFAGLGYDFIREGRREELQFDYRMTEKTSLLFYQGYFNELLEHSKYQLSGKQGRLGWKLDYRDGYQVDYYPYLELNYPLNRIFSSSLGLGRVSADGVMVDKAKLNLNYHSNIQLAEYTSLQFKENLSYNYYQQPEDSYRVLISGLTINHQQPLTTRLTIGGKLGIKDIITGGNPVLPADKVEEKTTFNPVLDLTYLTEEPDSALIITGKGSYSFANEEWEEVSLGVTRKLDCYSVSFDYDFVDQAFGFNINL